MMPKISMPVVAVSGSVVVVLAFLAGVAFTLAPARSDAPQRMATSDTQAMPSGVTKDGRTFGPLAQGDSVDDGDIPDLVAVIGDRGIHGYAESAVVLGGDSGGPSSPEEALRMQAARAKNGPVRVPVFAKDGVTQIDVFTLSQGPTG